MNVRMKLRREVGHGGKIPRGWQMAWYEPRRRLGVYYPPPLNWVMRAPREIGYRVWLALHASVIECAQTFDLQRAHRVRERMADEYARGYLIGWRECFKTCMDAVHEEISRSDDVWEIGTLLTDTDKPPRPSN
jgi:hypothetical protein